MLAGFKVLERKFQIKDAVEQRLSFSAKIYFDIRKYRKTYKRGEPHQFLVHLC